MHTHITISQQESTSNELPLWNARDVMSLIAKITSKYFPRSALEAVNLTFIGIARQNPYQASSSFVLKGTEGASLVEMLKVTSL